ncbi:cyclic nucleotide-binding domain-containing protein [filamentous cyanobacterium LEGE 11480]|uniref:Cyclic nucleotide-binding domain-containing protein n=2 Tax=Romeriopsis TaxID=2992131 RepID=A0A928VU34_9CYAN|nr:cyclic nucleotide-binding domain-containing protein [Romeriopsis navalis LEGE 11480]
MTVAIYSVIAMAIGNSLFVNHVGAKFLPLAFVMIGLCSIPAYGFFSQVVDRYSRPMLFRYVLAGSIVAVLGLWALVQQGTTIGYYGLLIFVFFQWDFHNKVLYPSLLTDYFTTLEYKENAPYVSMAQAGGILVGGGLTTVLSQYFRTRDLLLCLPVIFAIGIGQLLYLESSQGQVSQTKSGDEKSGILEAIQSFPDLVKRYPLALLLASSSFLLVMIYLSSEFLWFSIYGQNFSDEKLTGFLGLMRIVISVVQVTVVYGFTRPSLQGLGVAQMNVVYPITTLVSLLALEFKFGLQAAIGLHINGDALYKGINTPVHQLNYNAIPREFIPRIRALSDGFIYSIGLTLAGVLLWLGEAMMSLQQVTWLVVVLTVLLLLVRIPMGKFYGMGLEELIRSSSINLDDLDNYPLQLSDQSSPAIQELLTDADPYTQIKGLELAARIGTPSEFLSVIDDVIATATAPVLDAAIGLFNHCDDDDVLKHFGKLIESSNNPIVQEFALSVLIVNECVFDAASLKVFRENERADVQVLAAIAGIQVRSVEAAAVEPLLQQLQTVELSEDAAQAIVRIVQASENPALVKLLGRVFERDDAELTCKALDALATLAEPGNDAIAGIAAAQTQHSNGAVRLAAYDLLGLTRIGAMQPTIVAGFKDGDDRVRDAAAAALAAYGKDGLRLAQGQLGATNSDVVNTAIAAIGQVGTKTARNILFESLAGDFRLLGQTRKWQQQLPLQDENWQPLVVAIGDYQQRMIQRVLYVLGCLGHGRTVNAVNRLLATNAAGDLANAVEALATLRDRRFVLPLLPLLEQMVKQEEPRGSLQPMTVEWLGSKGYRLLLEALASGDRWIRAGALIGLAIVPSALVQDEDPFVRLVAGEIFVGESGLPTNSGARSEAMNRLLILKSAALFKNLSLDELLLIDQGVEQTTVLAGETIFAEGDSGFHLFVIASGQVKLVKAIDGVEKALQVLERGQYFGEVALFDDAPRWNGAIALEDCTLLKLEKQRFLSLMTQRPQIILEICRFLSQRLRETDRYRLAPQPPVLGEPDVG